MTKRNYVNALATLLAALLAAALVSLGTSQVAFSQEENEDKKEGGEASDKQATAQDVSAQATLKSINNSRGPLTRIVISNELNCQVYHKLDGTSGEFYPTTSESGACGTFLSVGGTLYSPSDVPAGASAEGTPFTPVSQSAVTGTGTRSNPYKIVTVVDAGTTGLRITQTDSYIVGDEAYRTDVKVDNRGSSSQNAILYRAGDCYLQNSDFGLGSADTATGAVRCVVGIENSSGQTVPGERFIEWTPLTSDSSYYEARYSEIWSKIGAQQAFGNLCARCSEYIDNGAGLSWNITVPAGGAVTHSHLTTINTGDGPTVTSTTPTAGATEVSPATPISATFSEGMSEDTLTTSTVKLYKWNNKKKKYQLMPAAGVSYDALSQTVTLTPSVGLSANTKYKVTIIGGLDGARDLSLNPLAVNKVWTFKTGSIADGA